MRSLYRPCPGASGRVLALVSAALLLASCGSAAAGQSVQSVRPTATGGTAQQQIRVSLARYSAHLRNGTSSSYAILPFR